jgi:hypothetical protein
MEFSEPGTWQIQRVHLPPGIAESDFLTDRARNRDAIFVS